MRIKELEVDLPFIEHLGIEVLEFGDGSVTARLQCQPHHCNSRGVVHGGALMSLLDFVMAIAARRWGADGVPDCNGNVTIEMKTSFLRPGIGVITAQGTRLQAGANLNFCEGELRDAQGRVVARGTGTFMRYRPGPETTAEP